MSDYLKQKAPLIDKAAIKDAKQSEFLKGMQELKASEAPVLDRKLSEGFNAPIKADKIDTIGKIQKIGAPSDVMDKIAAFRANRAVNRGLKALPGLGAVTQVTPALADLKEGNPNTAAARLATGFAPAGAEELGDKLMQDAQLQDKSPELTDPGYLKTLQAIGDRRAAAGKSPVVESFSGQQVDTSATEDSDFLNKIKAKMRDNSQG